MFNPTMKTNLLLLTALLSAGLLTSTSAFARGPGGSGNRGANRANATCDLSGPGQGTPLEDGSGKTINGRRGNPNSNGTPLRDGSGKASAPGKGPKNGTGNNANCPVVPTT
jgi:hypothetical protein